MDLTSRSFVLVILSSVVMLFSLTQFVGAEMGPPTRPPPPPPIAILSPVDGALVPGSFTVTGSATDTDRPLCYVEVQIDGGSFNPASGAYSWSYSASGITSGIHTITARAVSGVDIHCGTAQSINTASISLSVDSTIPSISITSHSNGAVVSGAFVLSGTTSDPTVNSVTSGVALVEVKIDTGTYSSALGTTSWSKSISGLADGSHTIYAKVTDGVGNTNEASIDITVSTPTADDTLLTLRSIKDVPWGQQISVSGTLTDSTTGTAIVGATVTFTGPPGSAVTDSNGRFSAIGNAPSEVGTQQIIAHFSGDSTHNSADSNVISYDTLIHNVKLSLIIDPKKVQTGGTFRVLGTLLDVSANNSPIPSKLVSFTSPLSISPTTTDNGGNYLADGLVAPQVKGRYSIQALFTGDSLYESASSAVKALAVR